MSATLEEQIAARDPVKDSWIARVLGVELPGGVTGGTTPGSNGGFSKVAFEKIHLEWENGKKLIQQRLDELNNQILAEFADDLAETAVRKLDNVLARLNLGFGDKLDDLRNATTPELQRKLAGEAGAIAESYIKYLSDDPLVNHIEQNPYDVEVETATVLGDPLNKLQQELAKLRL
jgi:hypothetical protein